MPSQIYEQAETRSAVRHDVIANKSREQHTSSPKLKFPPSKTVLWIGAAAVVILFALAYFFLMPVAEVATVQRGTAISAVYGTVRIEPAFVFTWLALGDVRLRQGNRTGAAADARRAQSLAGTSAAAPVFSMSE